MMIASVNSTKSKVLSLKSEGNEAFIKGDSNASTTVNNSVGYSPTLMAQLELRHQDLNHQTIRKASTL